MLSPIVHRGEQAQRDLVLFRSRDALVRARSQLINQVRGFAKSLGTRLPASSAEAFPGRVRQVAPNDLLPDLATMLAMIEQLTALNVHRPLPGDREECGWKRGGTVPRRRQGDGEDA